jgi:hopanoid biosynthesis associated RND transporter like protein HpnN
MLQRLLVSLILFSNRRAGIVALLGLALTVSSGIYAAHRLGIDTDQAHMLSAKLDWRQREIAFDQAFPQLGNLLVVVVDGTTPDAVEAATRQLTARLSDDHQDFQRVWRPDAGPFFAQDGLLLLDTDDVKKLLDQTLQAQPLLGQLAADPSPRGLFNALTMVATGVQMGAASITTLDPALSAVDTSLKSVLEENPQPLAWQNLLSGRAPLQRDLQHVILLQPKLDYTSLQAGGVATDAVRKTIEQLGYYERDDVRVRITGSVALEDEEFSSVAEGIVYATIGSLLLVIVWLVLALRSFRVILAIMGTLIAGGTLTAAFAALSVGTLNMISVAFAVLFIGIAVDFSIQFSMRYRDQRHRLNDLGQALAFTGRTFGAPIAVAAAAAAAGFYSFLPTSFKGVSELGLIAGTGMIIAFFCNMTILPALLTLLQPAPEQENIGFSWAAPLDTLMNRARWPISGLAALAALAGLLLLPRLHFDFDPLHLKNPRTESVSTLVDLFNDPLSSPYSASVLTKSPAEAAELSARLEKLPEVSHAISINSFIPADQATKLAMIGDAATILGPTLNPPELAPAPTIAEIREAAATCQTALLAALTKAGPDPAAQALADDLGRLAEVPEAMIRQLQPILISSLPDRLSDLREVLNAEPITLASLPADIKDDWISKAGQARLEIFPTGDVRSNDVLRKFYQAIKPIVPEATGSAIAIQQSSVTIVNAFRTAGISAICIIALILLLALRSLRDTLLVLGPLLLAGLLTVIACVLLPLPLNFANIIALPLLLGVGVAFDIYFVMNWRAGETHLLQSPTARAILFSALTTGTAFGSLALSKHPGTASMGLLLIISLGFTLLCTLFVLPALLAAFSPPAPSVEDRVRR